jgi:hypothetical protein
MSNNTLWFYWGQQHLSYLRWVTLFSALKIHTDVKLILRRDPIQPDVSWKEQQDFQHTNGSKNYFCHIPLMPFSDILLLEDFAPEIAAMKVSDVHTSDLLAWWILANHGGTIADMDIVFLKPLPEIKDNVQAVKFSTHPQADYTPVSFMQGQPCEVWRQSYNKALSSYHSKKYESCGAQCFVGEGGQLSECVVFPWAGLPWVRYRNWLFQNKQWPGIPHECIGIHWYAGRNQDFNQKINGPDDLNIGAMAWAIKEVIR